MASFTDLISVDLILLHIVPLLPISSLVNLASTCKQVRDFVHQTPGAFRHLDLSTCKTGPAAIAPIDRGGFSWRAERMDENLTEDDFYSGPLRARFSKLRKWKVLSNVGTLILDRQTVTADVVHDIINGNEFRVKILSLLEVRAMNMNKLQQAVRYSCRISRPEGTPRLQGLYIFSDAEPYALPGILALSEPTVEGVTVSSGAQLGAQMNYQSRAELYKRDPHAAYRVAGAKSMLLRASGWEETLQSCRDIIAFDAVLCRGPKHDPLRGGLPPAIASVCLGAQGCEQCGKMPEGHAIAGKSSISDVPLLRPIPTYAASLFAFARFEITLRVLLIVLSE